MASGAQPCCGLGVWSPAAAAPAGRAAWQPRLVPPALPRFPLRIHHLPAPCTASPEGPAQACTLCSSSSAPPFDLGRAALPAGRPGSSSPRLGTPRPHRKSQSPSRSPPLFMAAAPCDEDFAGLAEALARTPAAAKYGLVRPLSRGAFGSVVLAVQQSSGEQCAIKAMRIGCAANEGGSCVGSGMRLPHRGGPAARPSASHGEGRRRRIRGASTPAFHPTSLCPCCLLAGPAMTPRTSCAVGSCCSTASCLQQCSLRCALYPVPPHMHPATAA